MLLLTLLTAQGGPVSETVRSGSARDRVATDDADLALVYVSEHRGNLGTCGCSVNPRGGLPRLAGYLDAVERHGPDTPLLVVHAGWWASDRLDGLALHEAAQVQNQAMVEATELIGFDALNLSFRDTPSLRSQPVPAAGLSTNSTAYAAVRRVQAGDLDVAILGVSRPGSPNIQPEAVSWTDPVDAVEQALVEIEADLVVVLAFELGKQTADLVALPGVDVVIDAGGYPGKVEPAFDDGAVWVQSKDQGQAAGELRLWLDEDGAIQTVIDRWVDLDERIPESRPLRKLQRQSDRARVQLLEE